METIPAYAQETYAILFNRFEDQPFTPDYLTWFISKAMTKKVLHTLEKKGWIRRIRRGEYICKHPEDIIKNLVKFKVPTLLERTEKKYCYCRASGVEVWTDFSYIQRSWEHSPYFIKVLKKDLDFWVKYFRGHKIDVFIEKAKPSLGEFVVLIPEKDFEIVIQNNKPVEPLDKTIKFCEKNIMAFEYPLAYLVERFRIKTKAKIDQRVLKEVETVI